MKTREYTGHEFGPYAVFGTSAVDIHQKATEIAEKYFGVPVNLQVKAEINPYASQRIELPYRAMVTATEKK